MDSEMLHEGEDTFTDSLADPEAIAALEAVDDKVWNTQLHTALQAALGQLPEDRRELLSQRYFEGKGLQEIAAKRGVSRQHIQQIEQKALRQIRAGAWGRKLRPFREFDYYLGTGLQSFKASGMSVQEFYLVAQGNPKQ